MIRRTFCIGAACLSVLATGGATAGAGTSQPTGTLVFDGRPDARGAYGWQLLTGDLATGRVDRLVRIDGAVSPSWSPDGSTVVYELAQTLGVRCDSLACAQLWLVDADGRDRRRITKTRYRSESPDWSSTGRIAFVRWLPTRDPAVIETDIYSLGSNGHDLRRLTRTRGEDDDPAWSSDGTHVAFSSNRSGNFEIFMMNADGSGVRRLTTTENADEHGPAWSPDGTRIALWRRGVSDSIVVVDADGTDQQTLARQGARAPSWSPDGAYIAYLRATDDLDQADIWVMRADGTAKRKLIDGPFSEPSELDWTQQGR